LQNASAFWHSCLLTERQRSALGLAGASRHGNAGGYLRLIALGLAGRRVLRKFLRMKTVTERIGYSKASIYRLMDLGIFPRPYPLGLRSVGWLESDIEAYIESRIQAAPAEGTPEARKERLARIANVVYGSWDPRAREKPAASPEPENPASNGNVARARRPPKETQKRSGSACGFVCAQRRSLHAQHCARPRPPHPAEPRRRAAVAIHSAP
jgi:prophage regulatory protein